MRQGDRARASRDVRHDSIEARINFTCPSLAASHPTRHPDLLAPLSFFVRPPSVLLLLVSTTLCYLPSLRAIAYFRLSLAHTSLYRSFLTTILLPLSHSPRPHSPSPAFSCSFSPSSRFSSFLASLTAIYPLRPIAFFSKLSTPPSLLAVRVVLRWMDLRSEFREQFGALQVVISLFAQRGLFPPRVTFSFAFPASGFKKINIPAYRGLTLRADFRLDEFQVHYPCIVVIARRHVSQPLPATSLPARTFLGTSSTHQISLRPSSYGTLVFTLDTSQDV
ncbi:hypothetical protein C8R45DRAFT_1090692 [Mycena sanguinolenta]|nr:hypothetical protein C8R45DRAFT_1090692 [Mycena sanguinolenta]